MKILVAFLLGLAVGLAPDLASIYVDHEIGTYRKSECWDKGVKRNECEFDMYYDKFAAENPRLEKLSNYLILGEGPLYFVATGRCSNRIFYNPSATKESGKITNREYFWSRCSRLMNDASDLFFGAK